MTAVEQAPVVAAVEPPPGVAAVETWVVVLGHWAAGLQVIRNGHVHGRMERSLHVALNRKCQSQNYLLHHAVIHKFV